ncbi:hypothetical protein LCGC14_1138460 [marine sediment metagenome]|uniref:N-acetyltransferase domain-containing protein n=1 Tax=marine sediment metagenome TaxID=412755 RepID=A0A0F9PH72_9ZZZZ
MQTRLYTPVDAPMLKALLNGKLGDVTEGRDVIVVSQLGEEDLIGALAFRPVFLVHELSIGRTPLGRMVASELITYALATARGLALQFGIDHPEALFVVDKENDTLRRLVLERGAREEEPGTLYTMRIR